MLPEQHEKSKHYAVTITFEVRTIVHVAASDPSTAYRTASECGMQMVSEWARQLHLRPGYDWEWNIVEMSNGDEFWCGDDLMRFERRPEQRTGGE